MKLFLLLLISITSAFAQQDQRLPDGKWAFYGEEFYQSLNSGKNFEKELFNKILNLTHTSTPGKLDILAPDCQGGRRCYRHESVNYEKVRKIMFGELDLLKDVQGTYIVDVYCGKKFYFTDVDSAARKNSQVNIEHTWPQSKFSGKFIKDVQKSDMHHLYLADSNANAVRGNNPFGYVGVAENRLGGEGCDDSKFGIVGEKEVYTPPVSHRGNIARALFYFSMHYQLVITQSEEIILREWHKSDPVDESESKRHEKISRYQKIRNPFIDHPEIVDRILNF